MAPKQTTRPAPVLWLLSLLLLSALAIQLAFTSTQSIAEAHMKRGIQAQRDRQPDRALAEYQTAETYNPYDPGILYLIGILQKEAGNTAAASEAFTRSLTLAPNEVPASVAYAELLAFSGHFVEAEKVLSHALDLAPANWNAIHVAGLTRGLQNDHAGAATHFKQALKLAGGGNTRILYQLADVMYVQGENAQALKYANSVLRRQNLHPDNYLMRGKILLAMGNTHQAGKDLGWAQRGYLRNHVDPPKLDETRRYLYQAQIENNRPARAAQTLTHVVAAQGATDQVTAWVIDLESRLDTFGGHSDGEAQLNLGKVLLAVGEYERADQAFRRASRALPQSMRETLFDLRSDLRSKRNAQPSQPQ